jgi:transcriptional regulator with XRE-family HTH domain
MSDVAHLGPGGRRSRPLLRRLVGDVLRRNRLEQRRTLADVARNARVSKPYLSEVERGRKEASSEVLAAVCDALRIDLSDLLAEVGRDLMKDRAPVIRLDTARRRHDTAPRSDTGSRSDTGPRSDTARGHDASPSAPRSGDVVLLAA